MDEHSLIPSSKPFEFEFLTKLIVETQRNKKKLKKEWHNLNKFFECFPAFAESFDNNFNLKEDYIIDDLKKIYRQLMFVNNFSPDELRNSAFFDLYYYSYEPDLHKLWHDKNVELGTQDEFGNVNTGCCVVMKAITVKTSSFLVLYFTQTN